MFILYSKNEERILTFFLLYFDEKKVENVDSQFIRRFIVLGVKYLKATALERIRFFSPQGQCIDTFSLPGNLASHICFILHKCGQRVAEGKCPC